MELTLSLYENDSIFYLLTKENIDNCSTDMKFIYERLLEIVETKSTIKWIVEDDCLKLKLKSLTKKHVFLMDKFDGKTFQYLCKIKAFIVSCRCLIKCLLNGNNTSLPISSSPLYSLTMFNCVICASGIDVVQKKEMKILVNYMGGIFEPILSKRTTHLVTNTVRSEKYERAALYNIKIMKENWVNIIWEKCQDDDDDIPQEKINDSNYKVPPFYNLKMTATKIQKGERNKLKKSIAENGGTYCNGFKLGQIDVLITIDDSVETEKLKAAISCKVDCLTIDWIKDSIEKGYALPIDNYRINNVDVQKSTSTPVKLNKSSVNEFHGNLTALSEIPQNHSINETIMSSCSSNKAFTKKSTVTGLIGYKNLLENINMAETKEANLFLDGCSIFLCGFTFEEKEKLYKILNNGGATRYDEFNSNVTHVIVGLPDIVTIKQIKSQNPMIPIITLEWLIESISKKQPAFEDKYFYYIESKEKTQKNSSDTDEPSPASKKNIESMNNSFKKPFPKRLNFDATNSSNTITTLPPINLDVDSDNNMDFTVTGNNNSNNNNNKKNVNDNDGDIDDIMKQYLKNDTTIKPKSLTHFSSDDSNTEDDYTEIIEFLKNKKVNVIGFDEESSDELIKQCKLAGAIITNNYKEIDYLIVSIATISLETTFKQSKHIVNEFWFEECKIEGKIVSIEYYHKPIETSAEYNRILNGLTLCASTYTGKEREYIEMLVILLGAKFTTTYARLEETILICPSPDGAKYNAAIKWNLPAVSVKWLLKCYEMKRRLPMKPYLIGASITLLNDSDFDDKHRFSTPNANSTECSKTPIFDDVDLVIDLADNDKEDNGEICKIFNNNPIPGTSKDLKDTNKQYGDNIQNTNTPILKHKRITMLTGSATTNSPLLSQSSPVNEHNISDFVKEFPTPQRHTLYTVLKEIEASETPETKRRKKAMGTPPMPTNLDQFSPTQIRKQINEFEDRRQLTPLIERRKSTPFSEIKRKFLKDACGDAYLSPTPTWYSSKIPLPKESDDADADVSSSSTTTKTTTNAHNNITAETNTSDNVRILRDFINNRPEHVIQIETVESESEPFVIDHVDTEKINNQVVWQDPSQFQRFKYIDHSIRKDNIKKNRKFIVASTSPDLKLKIIQQIKSLQSELCDSSNTSFFDDTSTHLVCEVPNKGGKIFAAIAAGIWILSIKYIEDSSKAGYLLDEELYEWANPKSKNLPILTNDQKTIINAAYCWRNRIMTDEQYKTGAFNGFRVILLYSKNHDNFKRLLEAGSGIVLNIEPPFTKTTDISRATHCICDDKNRLSTDDIAALKNANVHFVSIKLIYSHLTSSKIPNPNDFSL